MSNIENEYFEWLCQKVTNDDAVTRNLYRRLLMELHSVPFTYTVPLDRNREADGLGLRDRFALELTHNDFTKIESITREITGGCSVLEMMVALVLRCEETIMDDTRFGNRTEYWFWRMINNMHLSEFTDAKYDRAEIRRRIVIMLNREYTPDGDGGLFYIPGVRDDLRKIEIWFQMLWYLDTIM